MKLRSGNDDVPGLEPIFYHFSVDIVFSGHVHAYERMWPTYNHEVINHENITEHHYHNANAPIYIITGAAVSHILLPLQYRKKVFRVQNKICTLPTRIRNLISHISKLIFSEHKYVSSNAKFYGYTKLFVENRTHLHLSQVGISHEIDEMNYIDHLMISKDML